MKTAEEYKRLPISEFTKTAKTCETSRADIDKPERQKGLRLHLAARKKEGVRRVLL